MTEDTTPSNQGAMSSLPEETKSAIISRVALLYTAVEHLIKSEAPRLSHGGRATMRRMQADIQRLRLQLMDLFDGHKHA